MRNLLLITCAMTTVVLSGCSEPTTTRHQLVDSSPVIDGVEVEVDQAGMVMFTAAATDPMGGELTYAWGSRALSPPTLSENQVVLDGNALRADAVVAHLVVQSSAGRIAGAQMWSTQGGAYEHTLVPMSAEEPCGISHGRCIAACTLARGPGPDEALDAVCSRDCLVGLALCRTNPS